MFTHTETTGRGRAIFAIVVIAWLALATVTLAAEIQRGGRTPVEAQH